MRALLPVLLLLPGLAEAACPSAAKCVSVGETPDLGGGAGKWVKAPVTPPPVEIGEILPRGKYRMMFNTSYYGLPPVSDGWVYYRIEDEIYRVDRSTLEVLERATEEANRAF